MQTINATEFKARCLDVLDRVNSGEIDELVVTKRGKIVARVLPPPTSLAEVSALFGAMAGTVTMADDLDLTAPVFEGTINAAEGIMHE
jgi:prevent-host-death family protein